MALGRVESGRREREVLHDRAGAEDVAARQRGLVAARTGVARDVDRALPRPAARNRCRSAISPTASTCRRGWRRRCDRSTTGISARTGRASCGRRVCWDAIEKVDDGELWETHQALKARLVELRAAARGRARRTPRRTGRVRGAAAPGAQPRRADDRFRAPVRHLQARQPGPSGSSRRSSRWSTTPHAGAVRLRRARRIRWTARARGSCRRSRG